MEGVSCDVSHDKGRNILDCQWKETERKREEERGERGERGRERRERRERKREEREGGMKRRRERESKQFAPKPSIQVQTLVVLTPSMWSQGRVIMYKCE